jgi:hypothetical protein
MMPSISFFELLGLLYSHIISLCFGKAIIANVGSALHLCQLNTNGYGGEVDKEVTSVAKCLKEEGLR